MFRQGEGKHGRVDYWLGPGEQEYKHLQFAYGKQTATSVLLQAGLRRDSTGGCILELEDATRLIQVHVSAGEYCIHANINIYTHLHVLYTCQ